MWSTAAGRSWDFPAIRSQLSEATVDTAAAKLRCALIRGEPCPVCDGTAHAVQTHLGLIDDRVEIDTQARNEARRDVFAAERDAAVEAEGVMTAAARLDN